MPQPTSKNFWKTTRLLQEESRMLREALKKDFKESRKIIARAKESMKSIKSHSLGQRGKPSRPYHPTRS